MAPRMRTGPGALGVNGALRRALRRVPHALVSRGLPPGALGHRWHADVPLDALRGDAERWRTLAPARAEAHPLPRGVARADELSDEPGWWGYSLRDVPARTSGECALLTLEGATLAFGTRAPLGEFHPALFDARGRSVPLREISARPFHRAQLGAPSRTRRDVTTWIAERVYDNHAHWLTAHLPKLLLARELGLLDSVVLPAHRTPVMRASLAAAGIDIDSIPAVPVDRALVSGTTHVLVTDRFDARLLRRAQSVLALPPEAPRARGLWISRARSRGRRLLEEEALMPRLERLGIERVFLEDHDFDAQRRLLAGARLLVGTHGAGLTGMLCCAPGADIVEIVDPDYPNPNFYAMAAALGHGYRRVAARAVGTGHALFHDLSLDAAARDALLALPELQPRPPSDPIPTPRPPTVAGAA